MALTHHLYCHCVLQKRRCLKLKITHALYECFVPPLLERWHGPLQPPDRCTKGPASWNWRQEDPWLLVGNGQHVRNNIPSNNKPHFWLSCCSSSVPTNCISLNCSPDGSCSQKCIWSLMQTSELSRQHDSAGVDLAVVPQQPLHSALGPLLFCNQV